MSHQLLLAHRSAVTFLPTKLCSLHFPKQSYHVYSTKKIYTLSSDIISNCGHLSLSQPSAHKAAIPGYTHSVNQLNRLSTRWLATHPASPTPPQPTHKEFTAKTTDSKSKNDSGGSAGSTGVPLPRRRKWRTKLMLLLAIGVLLFLYSQDNYFPITAFRFVRSAITGGLVAADYKYTIYKSQALSPAEQRKAMKECHARCAQRLRSLFQTNQGIYIKAGQHIACLDYIIPIEYTETMRIFQDQAPHLPYEEIRDMIEKELRVSPEKLFVEFDKEPIASASLAQVHRAVFIDESGKRREVAVKIQFPGIQEKCWGDVKTIAIICNVIVKLFPEFHLKWLIDEFNQNLPLELDFMNEAQNSERVKRNFAKDSRAPLYVPRVYWEHTTSKVLTMEYIDGVKVNDLNALRSLKVTPRKVTNMLSEVFCKMIFQHGFVHCDPHPGNLLLRRKPGSKGWDSGAELVLLDHGLYKELRDSFRLDYARLWLALINGHEEDVQKLARKVAGEKSDYKMLASMLTARVWEGGQTKLNTAMTESERDKIRENASDRAAEVTSILSRCSSELLLLFKTNDLLRSINTDLGLPHDTHTYHTMLRYCQGAINRHRYRIEPGFASRWQNMKESSALEFRLLMHHFMTFFAKIW